MFLQDILYHRYNISTWRSVDIVNSIVLAKSSATATSRDYTALVNGYQSFVNQSLSGSTETIMTVALTLANSVIATIGATMANLSNLSSTAYTRDIKYGFIANLTAVRQAVDGEILAHDALRAAAIDAVSDVAASIADPIVTLDMMRVALNQSDSTFVYNTVNGFSNLQQSFLSNENSRQAFEAINISFQMDGISTIIDSNINSSLSSEVSRTIVAQLSVANNFTSISTNTRNGATDYSPWFV